MKWRGEELISELKSTNKFHKDAQWNIEYIEDIINKMFRKEELNWQPLSHIPKVQSNKHFPKFRRWVCDYLTYFHWVFKVKDQQTLYLAVQIMDLYLTKVKISKDKFQLIASVWMLIAEKYEEIYPNPMDNYIKLAMNLFSKEDMKEMEHKILKRFSYKVEIYPTSFRFFNLFAKLLDLPKKEFNLGNFILHIWMFEVKTLDIQPSLQGAAALIISKNMIQGKEPPYITDNKEVKIMLRNWNSYCQSRGDFKYSLDSAIIQLLEAFEYYLSHKSQYPRLNKKFKRTKEIK